MSKIEILAPVGSEEMLRAAVFSGADAVYLGFSGFNARTGAGNFDADSLKEAVRFCHARGVAVHVALNTTVYGGELAGLADAVRAVAASGADAVICQDLAVAKLIGDIAPQLPRHGSTQMSVHTLQGALELKELGFARVVLARELSLPEVEHITKHCGIETECFVHGALCMCVSGQCYMSERIAGRSANRGECIQACRSLYDLVDEDGNVLVRNKALLSLKDYNLKDRLQDLADAGICSFKIEGRLKNISYVRNVVRAYSLALDELVAANPEKLRRVSFGRSEGGFTPDLAKTFNRGYTQLFLDGKRSGNWSSMDAPKSIGEEVGTVVSIAPMRQNFSNGKRPSEENITITLRMKNPGDRLQNGDGFSFLSKGRGEIVGFRGDVCQGNRITCRNVTGLYPGAKLYRNLSGLFLFRWIFRSLWFRSLRQAQGPKRTGRRACRSDSANQHIH